MRALERVTGDITSCRCQVWVVLTWFAGAPACSVDKFFKQSDPERENLCLYGHQDGNWEVDLPAEEVPPELPEPALGINFARDGMQVIRNLLHSRSVAGPGQGLRGRNFQRCGIRGRVCLMYRCTA